MAKAAGTFACVGYNHTLTANTVLADRQLAESVIGTPITISARFREHWGGIFRAHPWLNGPQDTYLGFWQRGGGACGEHSHAINLWQHFASMCGMGRIREVSAKLDIVQEESGANYDRICLIHVITEHGFVGDIAQDVVTEPAQKVVRIQGNQGFLEWYCNFASGQDAVLWSDGNHPPQKEIIEKTRPDDFKGEIDHIEQILQRSRPESVIEEYTRSPIALERGLDTMLVVAAVHLSHQEKKAVKINYEAGYRREALELC